MLHQLCSFLPEGSLACFAAVDPSVDAPLDPELDWIPIHYATRPRDVKPRLLPGRLGSITSFAAECYTAWFTTNKLADKAANFGKEFGADRIWCVMEGQTMFRLAVKVSQRMQVPLLTHVWDPPGWWMRANSVDRFSRKLVINTFDQALRQSRSCACASWVMADDYNKQYGLNALPVMPSLDASWAMPPAQELHSGDTVIIGIAGKLYSETEWLNLLATLDHVGWRVGGKKIILRILARSFDVHTDGLSHIEFLGWRDQREAITLLNEADILYCPYWFDPVFEKEARQSFPSKLTTYLAAGRPVFFHGPTYASPVRFLKSYDAAVFCHDLARSNIYNSIYRLILDPELYRSTAYNGTRAFMENLTLNTMRSQFFRFLGEEPSYQTVGVSNESPSFAYATSR